jgi:catechol 2,3-dioxygenase-like lactoylglutathione lyase family enzyme
VPGKKPFEENVMPIETLDHYSVRTSDVEKTRTFYETVIGLHAGPRPDFPFPGAWMYKGDQAVVHIIGVDPTDSSGLLGYLGNRAESHKGTGSVDHIAFVASDLESMRRHFDSKRIDFREREVPGLALHQIFLVDPNGVTIELNFRLAAA